MKAYQKLAVLGLLTVAPYVSAQEVPVTAKIRQTVTVSVPGKPPVTTVAEGEFYRASDGSQLTVWKTDPGAHLGPAVPFGRLISNRYSGVYVLNYRQGNAIQQAKLSNPFHGPHQMNPSAPTLGEDSVEGVKCTRLRAKLGSTGQQIGESCFSFDYGLELRSDVSPPHASNPTRIVEELYGIQLNVEPDPKLFDLTGFTQLAKQDSAPSH